MDIQNIIVILIVLLALLYVVFRGLKKFTTKKGTCNGCDKCGH